MKKKKLLSFLVCMGLCAAAGGALTACENDSADTSAEKTQIEEVYDTYVAHAEAQGATPLSYEEWLKSIKGDKGDKGDQGEKGDKGETGEKGDKGDEGRGIDRIEVDYEYDNDGNEIMIFRVYYKGESEPEIIPVAVPSKVSYISYKGSDVFGVCGENETPPVLYLEVEYEDGKRNTIEITDDMYVGEKPDFTKAGGYGVEVKYKGKNTWVSIEVREEYVNYTFDETVVKSLWLEQSFVVVEPSDDGTSGVVYVSGSSPVPYVADGSVMLVSASDIHDGNDGNLLFTADTEKKTISFYQPADDSLGSYTLDMYGDQISVDVYAPYKEDGENVAVLSGKDHGEDVMFVVNASLTVDETTSEITKISIDFLCGEYRVVDKNYLIDSGITADVLAVYLFDENVKAATKNELSILCLLEDNQVYISSEFDLCTYNEVDTNVISFELYGKTCYFFLDKETKTASFYQPAEENLIDTYFYESYYHFIIKVYKPLTEDGDNVAVIMAQKEGQNVSITTVARYTIDKETSEITSISINTLGEFTIGENNNLIPVEDIGGE